MSEEKKLEMKNKYVPDAALFSDIVALCSEMSVSGFERRAHARIGELYSEHFDEIRTDAVGNCVLVQRSERQGAPKIMIDAHLDEVGMLVCDVLEGGFLRIVSVGGIDRSIMQASDVVVYGKEQIRGVVCSVPPHLSADKGDKLPQISELLVDVGEGYMLEELCELCGVGTPVGYAPVYSQMGDGYIAGKSLDDKACAAIALRAVINTPREELAGDVYICLSAQEETSRIGGVCAACFFERPDYAAALDVNLGSAPDAPERDTVGMKKGISICYSAATDRALTRESEQMCREREIPFTVCAAPSSTGTNATAINLVREGIPVVDVGLPLRNMHTYNEVVALDDAQALYGFVVEFIKNENIAKRFGRTVEK